MTPTASRPVLCAGTAVRCDVTAWAVVQADAMMLKTLRQQIDPPAGEPLTASFLKHLDEQTLAALEAVFQAIRRQGMQVASFAEWAILAVPRFLGRSALAACLQRYAKEGAWGMSPHLIPHRTLHSVSGTLSLALKTHGINFGLDGGSDGPSGGLMTASALLTANQAPGVWLVLTGWQPEPVPDRPGGHPPSGLIPVCQALALALVPARPRASGWHLHITPTTATEATCEEQSFAPGEMLNLEELMHAFVAGPGQATRTWRLSHGGQVVLTGVEDGEDRS